MIIRKYKKEDSRKFIKLCSEFYNSEAVLHTIPAENIERTAKLLDEGSPYADCYIMEENGETVGYCLIAITYSNEAGGICKWIEELYITPEQRGRGIGGKMLDFLEQTENFRRLRLEIEKSNTDAERLYRRKGFVPLGYEQFVKDI